MSAEWNTPEWEAPGTFLVVFDSDGARTCFSPADESAIDAGVSQYLKTKQDSLLHLTLIEGTEIVMRASMIMCWFLSTPEHRERTREMERAQKAEDGGGWEE